jgi:hypothetical protein
MALPGITILLRFGLGERERLVTIGYFELDALVPLFSKGLDSLKDRPLVRRRGLDELVCGTYIGGDMYARVE